MAIPLRTDLIVTPDSVAEKVFESADDRKAERLAMKEMLSRWVIRSDACILASTDSMSFHRVYAHQAEEDRES